MNQLLMATVDIVVHWVATESFLCDCKSAFLVTEKIPMWPLFKTINDSVPKYSFVSGRLFTLHTCLCELECALQVVNGLVRILRIFVIKVTRS